MTREVLTFEEWNMSSNFSSMIKQTYKEIITAGRIKTQRFLEYTSNGQKSIWVAVNYPDGIAAKKGILKWAEEVDRVAEIQKAMSRKGNLKKFEVLN